MKVAVYGTLRKGLGNNAMLTSSKYIGSFESEPEYIMCSINNMFPGIKREGDTSIYFEVYEVDLDTLKKLDRLEGYISAKDAGNLYNRKRILTPWGKAMYYLYNKEFNKNTPIIASGNWIDYCKNNLITKYV